MVNKLSSKDTGCVLGIFAMLVFVLVMIAFICGSSLRDPILCQDLKDEKCDENCNCAWIVIKCVKRSDVVSNCTQWVNTGGCAYWTNTVCINLSTTNGSCTDWLTFNSTINKSNVSDCYYNNSVISSAGISVVITMIVITLLVIGLCAFIIIRYGRDDTITQ